MKPEKPDERVKSVLEGISLPVDITIRAWRESDFPTIQHLSTLEGWPTPTKRSEDSLQAWSRSWPALVAVHQDEVIGFLRAISDGHVTTYLAEILVGYGWRGKGVGSALLKVCHRLLPENRIDLLATETSQAFYQNLGFKSLYGFRKVFHPRIPGGPSEFG